MAQVKEPISFFGSRFIFRAAKTENPVPPSFFAPKPNGSACYQGYIVIVSGVLVRLSHLEPKLSGWNPASYPFFFSSFKMADSQSETRTKAFFFEEIVINIPRRICLGLVRKGCSISAMP